MAHFDFVDNKQHFNVLINENSYPVIKSGTGIPCLMICLGTPLLRTISKNFTQMFEIYSSDMYWVDSTALDDPESVTIDTIIDDVKALADALKLKQYVIFAHSAFGIIALEFAKKYPNSVSGIIMVGTPLNSNKDVAEMNNEIFQREADEKRKLIDAERRAQIEKEDLNKLNASDKWLREYVYRDAPRYWHIPDFDCTELWNGIHLNRLIIRLFSDILPNIDVLKGIKNINQPVFLAAGMSDYDCCPWVWKNVDNLPENFTISTFKKSGHWPHYEEPDLFDIKIKQWIEANLA